MCWWTRILKFVSVFQLNIVIYLISYSSDSVNQIPIGLVSGKWGEMQMLPTRMVYCAQPRSWINSCEQKIVGQKSHNRCLTRVWSICGIFLQCLFD